MRTQTHTRRFAVAPEELFEALRRPTAICAWWGASQAIVEPVQGGLWAASWGDPDEPDYVSSARIASFDPPRALVLEAYRYYAREETTDDLPLDSGCSFLVAADPNGALLTVVQSGFPDAPQGDAFFQACHDGWTEVLASLRDYLEEGAP